ncbi:hypothetical protein BRADI_3g47373v3 [Brachypodium distachyon]|uniref:Uncharacterized protein n=1 Tax=Brachypodium distachyon TaxID=15368 RepID=A0A0Q3I2L5_BRADI|nr:hypothetical protein BRADI_3g47373v3 [Brachypodium distachyon]
MRQREKLSLSVPGGETWPRVGFEAMGKKEAFDAACGRKSSACHADERGSKSSFVSCLSKFKSCGNTKSPRVLHIDIYTFTHLDFNHVTAMNRIMALHFIPEPFPGECCDVDVCPNVEFSAIHLER